MAPASDPGQTCVTAIPFALNTPLQGNNQRPIVPAGLPSCQGKTPTKTAFYRFSAFAAGRVYTFSTCFEDTKLDTRIFLYYDESTDLTTACGSLSCIGFNDDGGGACQLTSDIAISACRSGTIIVAVDGYDGATGSFVVDVCLFKVEVQGSNFKSS